MKGKLTLNNSAFYELRRDPSVVKMLEDIANKAADACNSDAASNGHPGAVYAAGSIQGAKKPFGRWFTSVITTNGKAIRDNHENDTMLKNIQGGGM